MQNPRGLNQPAGTSARLNQKIRQLILSSIESAFRVDIDGDVDER
jgi:hypothetical protein